MEQEAANEPDERLPVGGRPGGFSSLASKLILFVFTATFVTAIVVSGVSIQSSGRSMREMIDRLYPLSAEHAAGRVAPWLQGIRLQLQYAVQDDAVAARDLPDAVRESLDGLVVYGPGAEVRHTWGSVPAEAAAVLDTEAGIAAVRLASGDWGLAVSPRSQGRGSQMVGIVSLARLEPMLELELPDPQALLAVVDADGRILARAGRTPGDARVERLPIQSLRSRGVLHESDLAGEQMIGAARPLGLLDWSVAVLTPFEVAYAPVLELVMRIFVIDLAIILVFSFLAYRVTARTVGPIARLSEAAGRAAAGETDLDIPEVHSRDEIGLLTRTFNEMIRRQRRHREQIERANRDLQDRNDSLQQANEVLNQLSITDGLTKLHNHRFFQDHLTREIRRVDRTGEPLSILLLDIDDFKRLNDRLGHAAGDEILTRIAQILLDGVRASDLCARYGGEEFVILAPNTAVQGAYELAEKLRTAIAESSFIVDDSLRPLRATVSVGVAAFAGNRKRFFQKADQALYRAKADGKNCVIVHEDDLEADAPA
jgi:diguanylate cyclase (GGDEF)-like protein